MFVDVGIHVPPESRLHKLHMDISVCAEMYFTVCFRNRLCLYIIYE